MNAAGVATWTVLYLLEMLEMLLEMLLSSGGSELLLWLTKRVEC